MTDRNQSDGAIFTNNYKKKDTHPDWTGEIPMPKELLKELVDKVKEGEDAVVKVALWDRVSKNGNEYKYARFESKKESEKNESHQTQAMSNGQTDSDDFEDDIPF